MAHGHAHDDHDEHDEAHDDHHEEAPPPEPETPFWLTALGAVIFLVGGIAFLVANADPPKVDGANGAASAAAAKAPAP